MITKTGFRGLSSAQKDIIAHWEAVKGDRSVPGKRDINPGALRAHLAAISIVEVEDSGEARFRIAGSGLRRLLGGEMRGRPLSELEGEAEAMLSLGLTGALQRGEPMGGIIERDEDRHAWLRLPLESETGKTCLVLCHDVLLAHKAPEKSGREDFLSFITRGLAA